MSEVVGRIFCPACGGSFPKLGPGTGGRPDASCPFCHSLERHRLLAMLLRAAAPSLTGARVLDVAPSDFTTRMFRAIDLGQLIGLDFDPGADRRGVDVQASITDLPFDDGVIDFAVCYHVFEHVPDDRLGMAELARVLRPDGIALVQVPWRAHIDTDEETVPLTPAERLRRFGQADHVRYYGRDDVDDRLRAAGLEVHRFAVQDVVGPHARARLGLKGHEPTWVVRPAGGPPDREPLDALIRRWVHAVLGPDGDELPELLPELVAVASDYAAASADDRVARARAAAALRARDTLAAKLAAERGAVGRRDAELARLRAELARIRARSERQQATITWLQAQATELRAEISRLRAASPRGRLGQVAHAAGRAVPEPARRALGRTSAMKSLRRRLR